MTSLPRSFCPDCVKPLEDGQRIHGFHREHWECYEARLRGEFPSETGRNWSQPLSVAIFDPEWKPVPDKLSKVGDTGWLAPDGKFYGCWYGIHVALGDALAQYFEVGEREGWSRASQDLETAGWAHIGPSGVYWRTDDRNRSATQAQRDVLWDWFFAIKDQLSESDRDQRTLLWTLERLFKAED